MTKHSTILTTATLLAIFAPTPLIRADIFQWEYINPANPSLGKQQSTTLAPDGAGANAVPGMDLSHRNLTMAYLIGADLTGGFVHNANLTNADMSQANLTNVRFDEATLPGANLTGTEIRGANLRSTGITLSQLYSTASYLAHDLTGTVLAEVDLAGANFAGQNLTNASFSQTTLTGVNLSQANLANANFTFTTLTNANLGAANLTGAYIYAATLTGADFTGAEVRGARFSTIAAAQLYSTASYQAHDLTGIGLYGNLVGVNLAGQNLTSASFEVATLTNANLSQANLTGAYIYGATLTGANLTGANVTGADFFRDTISGTGGITTAQLYSTASYQAHDLSGIKLRGNDLTGVNFAGVNLAGQNLTSANFRFATLTNANFNHANLTGADFSGYDEPIYDEDGNQIGTNSIPGAGLSGANLSGADARGANFYLAWLGGANKTNLIQSDGHIAGLNLSVGASLVVRDYDGNLPIGVDQHLAMDATGTLQLVFDADAWGSTISFAAGIPVTRGGTLELAFAPGVNVATHGGRTIDLFDWTGVTPTGAFTVSSPHTWNLSNLYTTGEVTLTAVPGFPGDFNNSGTVDAADYVVWRKTGGTPAAYNTWRANFGTIFGAGSGAALPSAEPLSAAVPEPGGFALLGLALPILLRRRARRSTWEGVRTQAP